MPVALSTSVSTRASDPPFIRERSVSLLDVSVTPATCEQLIGRIDAAVRTGDPLTIAGHNLHSVYLTQTTPSLRRFYQQADIRLIDGMPVLAALVAGSFVRGRCSPGPRHRLGSTDWIVPALRTPTVRRAVLLGSAPDSNAAAVRTLTDGLDGVEILGLPADPWRDEEFDAVVERLVAFAPDLVLIGMGMPLQERVAEKLRARLDAPVLATVGGAIDQLSGVQSLAPRWLGRLGLEWLWRLAADPRRMAHRYLIEPVRLARLLVGGTT